MALRGNLKDFSLPDVFQLVQLSRKTGLLRIVNADAEGSIWFRGGEVFFAQSNWRKDRLGERLVNAQRITPSALTRALDIHMAEGPSGRRLGEILVAEGYITQQVLETFVTEQIQDTIFDLMRWDAGDFDFEVLPDIIDEDIGLSVSVENIVMEGSRRLEEWQRIKKKVPSMDMVFKMATAPGEGTFEISLKPAEWAMLLLIDGTRSVRELAYEMRSTDFEIARVIYGLFAAGLLEVTSEDEAEQLKAERIRREEERITEAGPVTPEETSCVNQELVDFVTATPHEPEPPVAFGVQIEREVLAEVPRRASELPQFLTTEAAGPSQDDVDVFEQMMEAVLGQHTAVIPETGRYTEEYPREPEVELAEVEVVEPFTDAPVAEEESECVSAGYSVSGVFDDVKVDEIPAPVADERALVPPDFRPSGDFEADLRTIGLGEYPEELLRSEELRVKGELPGDEPVSSGMEAAELSIEDPSKRVPDEVSLDSDSEDVCGPELSSESVDEYDATVQFFWRSESLEGQTEDKDLSLPVVPLNESVSIDAGLSVVETVPVLSGEDRLIEPVNPVTESSPEDNFISTDVYLADFEGDTTLSGGLGDELAALTGAAGRSRPRATVSRLPIEGESHMLHRDQMVNRDLIVKIIEGLEQL